MNRVIVFNRYSILDTTLAARLNGATVELLNWYGDAVARYTLNGNAVQTNVITLFPPTPTTTATPSSTASPSGTGTQTSSATSTLSVGAAPSISVTPVSTVTSTSTQTPSPTPSNAPLWVPSWMEYLRGQTYGTTSPGNAWQVRS